MFKEAVGLTEIVEEAGKMREREGEGGRFNWTEGHKANNPNILRG